MARLSKLWCVATLALATGCIPTFEDAECYADLDCPLNLVCVATQCVPPSRDAGVEPDAGVAPDAEADAGSPADAEVDAGAPDLGFPDASAPDAGPPDAGEVDAGAPDSGPPDTGPPDGGFDVRLEPAALDFGVVRLGCPVPAQQVSLQNAGPTPVQITSIGRAQGTTGEYAVSARSTPFMLAPAASETIDVAYTPQAGGVDPGALEVTWGQPAQLLSTSLQGEGVVSAVRTDTFTQAGGPLDVLFVVNDTQSMTVFQNQLASDLVFLMVTLAYEGWDYQIGVTTADTSGTGAQGALLGNPRILTAQTANVEMVLAQRITSVGVGSMISEGMEAARLALTPPLATTGANAGFLRPDAALLVIFTSNEDDDSPMMVAQYASFLNGLKGAGNDDRVAANVIVSSATVCTIPMGSALYAGRYLGLAPLTGGVSEHICDASYQSGVSTTPPIDRPTTFALSARADPATIVVTVDGSNVPSNAGANWSYDAVNNAVEFTTAAAPDLGLVVEIDYSIACN